jgi:hypothetical protein
MRELSHVPATPCRAGYESWSVTPAEAFSITDARYEHGPTRDEVAELATKYPTPPYWWIIEHDF